MFVEILHRFFTVIKTSFNYTFIGSSLSFSCQHYIIPSWEYLHHIAGKQACPLFPERLVHTGINEYIVYNVTGL